MIPKRVRIHYATTLTLSKSNSELQPILDSSIVCLWIKAWVLRKLLYSASHNLRIAWRLCLICETANPSISVQGMVSQYHAIVQPLLIAFYISSSSYSYSLYKYIENRHRIIKFKISEILKPKHYLDSAMPLFFDAHKATNLILYQILYRTIL